MIGSWDLGRAGRWVVPAAVVGLVVVGWLDLVQHYRVDAGIALYASLARALPLLVARRWPVAAVGTVLAVCTVVALTTEAVSPAEPWPWAVTSQAAVLGALGLAGLELDRRWTAGLGAGYVLLTVGLVEQQRRSAWGVVVSAAIGAALVFGAVEVLRRNRETRRRLVEQEEISEAERTRRTLLEERARIGRELHDVVAHHMSLIAVRAETAPFRIPEQTDLTRAEFREISGAAREALTDMRRLLGLLRADTAGAEKAPQPTLAELPQLVASAPDATLAVSGSLEDAPPIVGVTAYRVVQESLSNARRHAAGSPVTVRLVRTAAAVRLEIRNDRGDRAVPASAAADGTGGMGLVGMAERVGTLGGEFSAGPTADGGFEVTAVLPLTGEEGR